MRTEAEPRHAWSAEFAYMTFAEFEALPEYSDSVPPGNVDAWRARDTIGDHDHWTLARHEDHPEGGIVWRQIFIVPERGTWERGT